MIKRVVLTLILLFAFNIPIACDYSYVIDSIDNYKYETIECIDSSITMLNETKTSEDSTIVVNCNEENNVPIIFIVNINSSWSNNN